MPTNIPLLVTPINTSNIATGGNTTTTSTASTASTTSTATSATNDFKNSASGLDSLLNLGTQAIQIGGAIKYQRQQSGAAASRQARIAQCGRKPLIGRARKEAYRKCLEAAQTAPLDNTSGGNDNKNLGGGGETGSSMKFVWIGLALVAVGGIGYMLYKKSK